MKNPPAMQQRQEMRVQSLGLEDPLEEEMATHSNILARELPGTEQPGELQCLGVTKSWTRLSDTLGTILSAVLQQTIDNHGMQWPGNKQCCLLNPLRRSELQRLTS